MAIVSEDPNIIKLVAPSGLLIKASTAGNKVLDEFYCDYDAAFVLPNEKEGYAGFKECLQLNTGETYNTLVQRYGVFRECVFVAYDAESGVRVGGANFIVFPLEVAGSADEAVLSINLNYIFINPDARNRGYFRQLIGDLPEIAFRLLVTTNRYEAPMPWRSDDFHADVPRPSTLIFLEQNDPFIMSAEDYKLDTTYTGLDQFERIGIWTRLGAKIIDFPYVQPPLTSAQQADHNLVLAVLGVEAGSLNSCLLRAHLERFFAISVLKGGDALQNSSAAHQLEMLRERCRQGDELDLLSASSLIAPAANAARPASLRDALRN